ncbi:MAG: 4Fe-4S dicluster domain-containing protein [Rubrivivax sp.]
MTMDPARRAFLRGRANPAAEAGVPVLFGEACLARHGVECRVCGEACDAGAIRFPPRRGGAALPVADFAKCTGCGDCMGPCPVQAVSVAGR